MSMGYIDYLRNTENRENNESTKWISRSQFGIWMSSIVARIAAIFLFFRINKIGRSKKRYNWWKKRRRETGETREKRIGVCETLDMIRERLGANDANYTLQKMAIDRPNEHAPHVKKFLVSAQPEVWKKRGRETTQWRHRWETCARLLKLNFRLEARCPFAHSFIQKHYKRVKRRTEIKGTKFPAQSNTPRGGESNQIKPAPMLDMEAGRIHSRWWCVTSYSIRRRQNHPFPYLFCRKNHD